MNNWQTGLFDCYDDCGICCYGCWCTACLYATIAVQIDGIYYDEACVTYCMSGGDPLANMSLIDNRRTIRFKYRLVEEPCDDSSVISYCKLCAICQEARELKIQNNILVPMQDTINTAQPTNNMAHFPQVTLAQPISYIQPRQAW